MKQLLAEGYARVFARDNPIAQRVNHTLYHLALRGMGYNNGWQLERSGEAWFVRHILPRFPCRTVLDIGANVGEYSRLLLQETGATVYAFEPLPAAFAELEVLQRQYPDRFRPANVAVGRETGTGTLHFGAPTTEHATLSAAAQRIDYVGAGNTRSLTVAVRSLDELVDDMVGVEAIDFLKIDVEGFEFDVLSGASRTLERFRPALVQIEWNTHQLMTGNTLLDFSDLLGSAYSVYQLLPHGLRQVDPRKPEPNTFCYGNFVFARGPLAP